MELDISTPKISIPLSGIKSAETAVDVSGGGISSSIKPLDEAHNRNSSLRNWPFRQPTSRRSKQQRPYSPKPDPQDHRNPSNPRLMELMELMEIPGAAAEDFFFWDRPQSAHTHTHTHKSTDVQTEATRTLAAFSEACPASLVKLPKRRLL